MSKISALAVIVSVQSDDLLPVVDVHDTTMAATGTTKKITLAQLVTPLLAAGGGTMGAELAPKVVALTDAATVVVNASLGNDFRLLTTAAIGATRAIGVPSSPADGQVIAFGIQQDATGSRLVTWTAGAGGFSFGSGSAPTLSTAASALDWVAFRYHAGKNEWCYQGSQLGF